jgi:hypothetical protein
MPPVGYVAGTPPGPCRAHNASDLGRLVAVVAVENHAFEERDWLMNAVGRYVENERVEFDGKAERVIRS